MQVPKYEIVFLFKNGEKFFLASSFLFRARKIAKKMLRFNPLLRFVVIIKRGIEEEKLHSPFTEKMRSVVI